VTINEMHIAVDLGVQKVASFQADTLLPQEIDHELNMAMDRFVKQRYNPLSNRYRRGFEQSQKRIDDLRTLIEDVTIPQTATFGVVYNSNAGKITADRFVFPVDYQFLLNVKARVFFECPYKPIATSTTTKDVQYIKVPLDRKPGYKVQKIERYDEESTTFKTVIQAEVLSEGLTNEQLFQQNLYTDGIVASQSFDDSQGNLGQLTGAQYTTTPPTADSPIADGSEFYLRAERELDSEYDTFSAEPGTGTMLKILYIRPGVGTPESVSITTGLGEVQHISRQSRITSKKLTSCKFVTQDEIHTLLDDPFNTTKDGGPLYTVQENSIDVYCQENFVASNAIIRYLRRPQRMDKSLFVGCELPEHTHAEIVEMAVKSILEGFESPRYQTQTGEVLESE
tara:strand:- start:112 stop:1299 length:1188 start_codon:yes stop_codon:yes gene_type:complete